MWAPAPVGVSVEQVHPVVGWVAIQENHEINQRVTVGGVELTLAQPRVPNTVSGVVRAAHPDTLRELGVQVGDSVVYREWEGARWDMAGEVVLIMAAEHVLAVCEYEVE